MSTQEEETAFENEVRRVARWIYPAAESQGAVNLELRERDAVIITDDLTLAIEATVSTTAGKARYDAEKIFEAMNHLKDSYPDRPAAGMFITKREPTSHQRQAVKEVAGGAVSCMSLDTFRTRLIDVGQYLACRDVAPFGSARHPLTDSTIELGAYNPVDMLNTAQGSTVNLDDLEKRVLAGNRFVVTGDYGAGKSMTLRELYLRLSNRYRSGEQYRLFPVYMNMREHHGQTDPVEAIERHARNIGFERPEKLVRAWRAGMCILLLDGFDEIAPASLAGVGRDPDSIRDLNYRSVELLRRIIDHSEPGLVVSGRSHYFQNPKEMQDSLGLKSAMHLSLSDFTNAQMRQYLTRQGWGTDVPDWLPRRPLLLGWLASRDFLNETVDVGHLPASQGWNWLLGSIFERESKIEGGIDGSTLRAVLERVATRARETSSGLGPVYFEDLRDAYRSVLNYAPDERQEVLLRRLPGLGVDSAATGSKRFVDSSLADVARAGDLARHIESPDTYPLESRDWHTLLGALGVDVCADLVTSGMEGRSLGAVANALRKCARGVGEQSPLTADLLNVALSCGAEGFDYPIVLRDLVIPEFRLGESDVDLGSLVIEDCIVSRLDVADLENADLLPRFARCVISEVDGVLREEDLPNVFTDCSYDAFVGASSTTNELVTSTLPRGVRLGLVSLRKLYWQRGGSRRADAMTKGIPPEERHHIAEVLRILASYNFATTTRHGSTYFWQPVRSQDKQVRRWLMAPESARGPLFDALQDL